MREARPAVVEDGVRGVGKWRTTSKLAGGRQQGETYCSSIRAKECLSSAGVSGCDQVDDKTLKCKRSEGCRGSLDRTKNAGSSLSLPGFPRNGSGLPGPSSPHLPLCTKRKLDRSPWLPAGFLQEYQHLPPWPLLNIEVAQYLTLGPF